jgi:hypothetical protein
VVGVAVVGVGVVGVGVVGVGVVGVGVVGVGVVGVGVVVAVGTDCENELPRNSTYAVLGSRACAFARSKRPSSSKDSPLNSRDGRCMGENPTQ